MKNILQGMMLCAMILLYSCTRDDEHLPRQIEEHKISEMDKQRIMDFIKNRKAKTDELGKTAIDTILQTVNWDSYKIVEVDRGNHVTILELNPAVTEKLWLLVYSRENRSIYTDAKLATVAGSDPSNPDPKTVLCAFHQNKMQLFTGTITYYKVTRELVHEKSYRKGVHQYTRRINGKQKESSQTNGVSSRLVCTNWYLVTYHRDGTETWEFLYTQCVQDCAMTRSLSFSNGSSALQTRCEAMDGGGTALDQQSRMFNDYIQMQLNPVSVTAGTTMSGSDPISGTITWTVVEAAIAGWKVEAITHYSYTHETLFDINQMRLVRKYTMLKYVTTGSHFVGSNILIESTWTPTSVFDQILNNYSADAYGKSKVGGVLRHRLKKPLPGNWGNLDHTASVSGNELQFYPK